MKELMLPITYIAYAEDSFFGRFFKTPTQSSLIIKTNGEGVVLRNPPQSVLNSASMFFLGGHRNILTETQASVIVAAGFGEYIEETPDVP